MSYSTGSGGSLTFREGKPFDAETVTWNSYGALNTSPEISMEEYIQQRVDAGEMDIYLQVHSSTTVTAVSPYGAALMGDITISPRWIAIVDVNTIPEPTFALLCGFGSMFTAWRRRR